MTYNEKILECFDYCSFFKNEGKGASATDVTEEMKKRGWLSDLDTVIDIANLMEDLLGHREAK